MKKMYKKLIQILDNQGGLNESASEFRASREVDQAAQEEKCFDAQLKRLAAIDKIFNPAPSFFRNKREILALQRQFFIVGDDKITDHRQHFLSLCAQKPNHLILRYFIKKAADLKIDISPLLSGALIEAILHLLLSNVRAILEETDGVFARNFNFLNVLEIFYDLEDWKIWCDDFFLSARCHLVDITLLFYQLGNSSCQEIFKPYFNLLKSNDKNIHEKKRELIAIQITRCYYHRKEIYYFKQYVYAEGLIKKFNEVFSDQPEILLALFESNSEIFDHIVMAVDFNHLFYFFQNTRDEILATRLLGHLVINDLSSIQNLCKFQHCLNLRWLGPNDLKFDDQLDEVNKSCYEKEQIQVYRFLKQHDEIKFSQLPFYSDRYRLDREKYLKTMINLQAAKLVDNFIKTTAYQLKNVLPAALVPIILDYAFENGVINGYLEKLDSVKLQENEIWHCPPDVKQKPGSADCGPWSVWNTFDFITRDFSKQDEKCEEKFESKFKSLSPCKSDWTAFEIEKLFEQAFQSNFILESLFPELQEKLLQLQASLSMLPYSIINTAIVDGEIKLTEDYHFGGSIPHLKLQNAVNFLLLSQLKNSGINVMHFFVIGTEKHWCLAILTFEGVLRQDIVLHYRDSGTTSEQTLQRINGHITDLIINADGYAAEVAGKELPALHKMLGESSEEPHFLKYCRIIAQFFTVLHNRTRDSVVLSAQFLQSFIHVLNRAYRIAAKHHQELDWQEVFKELSFLHKLQVQPVDQKELGRPSSKTPAS